MILKIFWIKKKIVSGDVDLRAQGMSISVNELGLAVCINPNLPLVNYFVTKESFLKFAIYFLLLVEHGDLSRESKLFANFRDRHKRFTICRTLTANTLCFYKGCFLARGFEKISCLPVSPPRRVGILRTFMPEEWLPVLTDGCETTGIEPVDLEYDREMLMQSFRSRVLQTSPTTNRTFCSDDLRYDFQQLYEKAEDDSLTQISEDQFSFAANPVNGETDGLEHVLTPSSSNFDVETAVTDSNIECLLTEGALFKYREQLLEVNLTVKEIAESDEPLLQTTCQDLTSLSELTCRSLARSLKKKAVLYYKQ